MTNGERNIVINVDVQNDFCPGGSLAVAGGNEVVAPLNRLNRIARELGTPVAQVVFTRDWHPAVTNHFGPDAWPVHCVANTQGADFHPDVLVGDADLIMSKGTAVDEDAYSGFQAKTEASQSLYELVTPRHYEHINLFIGGLATDYCVKATVLDALTYAKDYDSQNPINVHLLTDAIRAVNLQPADGDAAYDDMIQAGAIPITSDEAIQIMGG